MLSGIGSSVKSILLLIISTTRTAVFYFCFALWTALWSTIVIFFIHTFCFRLRHRVFVKTWAIISVHLCRLICGVRWNVKGRENIPGNPLCYYQQSSEHLGNLFPANATDASDPGNQT